MMLNVEDVAAFVVIVEVVVVFMVVAFVVSSSAVVVAFVCSVTSVGENPLSVVVSTGIVNLYDTNTNTPRARKVPSMRRMERNLGSMLFGFSLDTCPSLKSFLGCRKKTTLASFPFISTTEPMKVLHLQFVRVCA